MLHLMQYDRRKLQELASQSAMPCHGLLLRRLLTEKKTEPVIDQECDMINASYMKSQPQPHGIP